MKDSLPFAFNVVGWVMMRSIVKSSQPSKIPSNMVTGSGLKEIQKWEWKNQDQLAMETEMMVVQTGLKKI